MRTFNHYHMGRLCPIIVTILATMLWGSLTAQEEPDTLLYVRVVEIHAGKTGEFVDLMQEMTAAREEAGMPGRWVWQEAVGNTSTYHIVTVGKNFAEFG